MHSRSVLCMTGHYNFYYVCMYVCMYQQSEKKLVEQQYLLHMSSQYGELWPTNGCDRFVSYCTDVDHWRPTKLCTVFGRFLRWYTIIHFRWLLLPKEILPGAKFTLSCILLYWQHYCTALEQWASNKLCSMVQGIELLNFRRGRHLYSAGRPSRWALAHILVHLCIQ